MNPHKHAALIKAWADGAQIQYKDQAGEWEDTNPNWYPDMEYRVKPNPDVVMTAFVYPWEGQIAMSTARPNLRLTFNFEGTKLLAAEVL